MPYTLSKTPSDATRNLQDFIHKRIKTNQKARTSRPTAEEYKAKEEQLRIARDICLRDADATKENISGMQQQWIRYISKLISRMWLIILRLYVYIEMSN